MPMAPPRPDAVDMQTLDIAPVAPPKRTVGRHGRIAGGILAVTSVPLFVLMAMLAAIAATGFSDTPPQLSTGDTLLLLALLAYPVCLGFSGLLVLCGVVAARPVALVLAVPAMLVWILSPLTVTAVILLVMDTSHDRVHARGQAS